MRARVEYGVDHQGPGRSCPGRRHSPPPQRTTALVAYDRDWDGNASGYPRPSAEIQPGRRTDLAARPRRHTHRARASALAEVLHRPACQACCGGGLLNHKQALRLFGGSYPSRSTRAEAPPGLQHQASNCSGCGRFITEHQQLRRRPNGARNAPCDQIHCAAGQAPSPPLFT
ncbi:hypothetical protein ACPA9J_00150 [Pseudomonas aeruginosa]